MATLLDLPRLEVKRAGHQGAYRQFRREVTCPRGTAKPTTSGRGSSERTAHGTEKF